ncbi:MAG: flagellar hook-associated protein 3 [Proteobacteria bacterium]|nr:MAG: flagellar hook-associated protein 3 [Pseudomonadota bacterium]
MRISTSQMFNRSLSNIQDVNQELQNTQLQLSSGKRVQTPSDDPVAATRILQINQDLDLVSQYQRNIDLVENRLRQEDDLLAGINDIVIRIRELTIQAGDGSQNEDDKRFIAAEIKERLSQLAGMMNSQDPSGEFIFSGFQGGTRPFEKNESGHYEYRGDEGQRKLQIDTSVTIPSNDSGKAIFVDIRAAENTFYTSANPENRANPPAMITTGQVIDQDEYNSFYPDDMQIQFNNASAIVPPGPNFSIIEPVSGRILSNPQPYHTGQPVLVKGVKFEIVGNPVPGDSFFIQSTGKQSLLTTVEKLIYGLENYQADNAGRQVLTALLDDTLVNLDNAQTAILETRSLAGARLNTVDTTREMHKDVELLTKEILSDLQDVDFAEATSELTLESFILDAAFSSFSRISGLSLFDRL